MRRFAIPVVLCGLGALLSAQERLNFASAERVTVRVMREIPAVEVAPGVRVWTVVGSTGSFSLADFEKGSVAPLHHHTREQADVSISGVFDITLGNHVEGVGPGVGFIVPPNVSHSIANAKGGVMTVVEGHTVRRPDLVPPRPAMTFPASPQAVAIPGERKIAAPLESTGASSGPLTTISGETCTLAWRRLEKGKSGVDVGPAGRRGELFVYVVRGDVGLVAARQEQALHPGTLVVVPGTASIRMRATGTADAAVVEFSPEKH